MEMGESYRSLNRASDTKQQDISSKIGLFVPRAAPVLKTKLRSICFILPIDVCFTPFYTNVAGH